MGLVHEEKESSSRLHRKTPVASPSVNEKVALVEAVTCGGAEVMSGAGGGVRSMVHVYAVIELSFPAGSRAMTRNVCAPSPRPLYVIGLEHELNSSLSRRQRNVAEGSSSVKLNVADELFDGSGGFDVTAGAGGGVPSTVTSGCWPWSENSSPSRKSVVVQS